MATVGGQTIAAQHDHMCQLVSHMMLQIKARQSAYTSKMQSCLVLHCWKCNDLLEFVAVDTFAATERQSAIQRSYKPGWQISANAAQHHRDTLH